MFTNFRYTGWIGAGNATFGTTDDKSAGRTERSDCARPSRQGKN
ncbi:unnamed protein product [Ciceribacter sp. T2.26MG-112.2]|nr:unnamed protein product [Ciceribacter naphthalenivorans]